MQTFDLDYLGELLDCNSLYQPVIEDQSSRTKTYFQGAMPRAQLRSLVNDVLDIFENLGPVIAHPIYWLTLEERKSPIPEVLRVLRNV